jgi:hypothetical protein
LEKTLIAALKTQPLPEQRLERIRAAVAQEWRIATDGPRTHRTRARLVRWAAYGACASVLAVLIVSWSGSKPHPGATFGSIARLDAVGIDVQPGFFHRRRLVAGDALLVGDRLTAAGAMLVALEGGGTLRVAAGSRLIVASATQLALTKGLIYVDFPAGSFNPLRIMTVAGDIEHIGTAFEVMSDDQSVRIRIRDGSIRFVGETATISAAAGTELLAVPGAKVAQRSVDTYGRDWLWIAALAPDFDIEGRPLIDFLHWVSHELGRPLDFADKSARQTAEHTILHGSVRGQLPIDALGNVLSTTSLVYEIRGDAIWARRQIAERRRPRRTASKNAHAAGASAD